MKTTTRELIIILLYAGADAFVPGALADRHRNVAFSTTQDSSTITNSVIQDSKSLPKTPEFVEVCDTVGVTLTRFMDEVVRSNPDSLELTSLFNAIGTACKAISNTVKRSQLPKSETLGYEGAVNVQGEDQKKLDVITNDILKRALRFTGKLGVLASEEEETPVDITEDADDGILFDEGDMFVAVFDPLDGSSNVDAGIPTGTIIGIYEHNSECMLDWDNMDGFSDESEFLCMTNTLQPGTKLVAAAYCLYSSSTFFVLTLGDGTYGFTLDENIGEFILSHPRIQIPESCSIYSMNEAKSWNWDEPMQKVHDGWKKGTGLSAKEYSSRYIGSMVGDVHRTLLYGGVFGYPADKKNPSGKLRLLYEGAPMSFIVEQAGGLSTTGTERVMEITPTTVHERVPIVMGSKNEVQEVIDAYREAASSA